nr:hypothetical protein [uncultured Methanolobus sp.]
MLTNITALCVADANSTSSSNVSLNVTNASGKNLTTQDPRYDNYIEGYDLKPETMASAPDSRVFGFSTSDLVASLIILAVLGFHCVAAMLVVFLVVIMSAKKKKN